ncbi:MAG: hypothetical protein IJS94_04880 [Clostridia bacterium]|nr:hypothetical protein [Clostridia bacterium]
MDLIEEYLKNISDMKMTTDDYGDLKKVKNRNRLATRNRQIAIIIEKKHPELKARFILLTESDDENTRLWAAHHALEVMTYELSDRKKALKVISEIAKHSPDELQRSGNKAWLKDYCDKHPQDR